MCVFSCLSFLLSLCHLGLHCPIQELGQQTVMMLMSIQLWVETLVEAGVISQFIVTCVFSHLVISHCLFLNLCSFDQSLFLKVTLHVTNLYLTTIMLKTYTKEVPCAFLPRGTHQASVFEGLGVRTCFDFYYWSLFLITAYSAALSLWASSFIFVLPEGTTK